MQALNKFIDQVSLEKDSVRVCDHQHVTYDLFSKAKGVTDTSAHKLRSIGSRYKGRDVELDDDHDELTYAIVDLPVSRRLLSLAEINDELPEKYNPLYALIADAFTSAAKHFHLNNGAVIANGLVPIVRESKEDKITVSGELQIMGYSSNSDNGGITCKWSSNNLVDTVQLIFVANERNKADHGYGKFLHQVEMALEMMAEHLKYDPKSEEMLVRFHQHVGFFK